MIGIQTIASYIPPFKESNYDKKEQFEISDEFIENKIGVRSKARKAEDEETSDMCCRAYEALTQKVNIAIDEIDCLIVCTQNPDGHGLPHTSAVVHSKLGGHEKIAAFDISLGCSGYVYSLSVATSFMQANKMGKGLLFTADPYSKIINPDDKNTSLLFGDAATVTLLSDRPVLTMLETKFSTRGGDGEVLQYLDDRLIMNGREVFNFSISAVPIQIKELVKSTGHTFDDIDLFVLHQGSKYMINIMTRRLNLDPQKVPINLAETGNTVSSSIPLILEDYLLREEYKNILISGFGVGLSWASSILTRTDIHQGG
jgi:3-oxoacyl-[acyl-carrier-protein] synthase-3